MIGGATRAFRDSRKMFAFLIILVRDRKVGFRLLYIGTSQYGHNAINKNFLSYNTVINIPLIQRRVAINILLRSPAKIIVSFTCDMYFCILCLNYFFSFWVLSNINYVHKS